MFNMKKNITLIMLSIALFTGFNSLLFAEKNKENSMSYVGKWVFHSIMSMDESGRTTFLNAEEYLNTLPDFIDKNNSHLFNALFCLFGGFVGVGHTIELIFKQYTPRFGNAYRPFFSP